MSHDYGAKGCRCWRSEDYSPWDDRTHGDWLPNANCPHHGLLADYTGGRTDTGEYRVTLPAPDTGTGTATPPPPLSPGAVACTRAGCDWTLTGRDEVVLYGELFRHALTHTTTEKEKKRHGRVLTAFQRFGRRVIGRNAQA